MYPASSTRSTATLAPLLLALLTGCAGAARAPADPASTTPPPVRHSHTDADVAFMSGMIAHHAQALEMAALAGPRAERTEVRAMAERIAVSQQDEIALLRTWLHERGQPAPTPAEALAAMRAHAAHGMAMPGMVSDAEMARLAAARGAAFDDLFLELMIRHHAGAVEMVETLFAAPGAAQDETVFRFSSDVLADQAAEIERMQALRARLRAQPGPQ